MGLWMTLIWGSGAVLVIAGTLLPARLVPAWLPDDKLLHRLAYGALALPPALFLPLPWVAPTLCAILLLGWCLEWAQQWWVPGRRYCRGDLRANLLGVAAGTGIGLGLRLVAGWG